MKEAYVQKMVKVFNEHDRWSLISLSNNSGKNLELKFVSALRRQFEFSVDSFQIILDRLLETYMQQESHFKINTVELKEQPREQQTQSEQKYSPLPLKQASSPKTESHCTEETPTSLTLQRDEAHEKESQTELSHQTEDSNQTKHSEGEKDNKVEPLADLKEAPQHGENINETDVSDQTSPNLLTEKRHISEKSRPITQTELNNEPELKQSKSPTEVEHSEQTHPCDNQQPPCSNHKELSDLIQQTNHTKPPNQQKQLTQHIEQAELPQTSNKTQTESVDSSEMHSTDFSNCLTEDRSSTEKDQTQYVSTPDSSTSLHAEIETRLADEGKVETETETETEKDTGISEMTEEISASEAKTADTEDIDRPCSNSSMSLTPHNTQPPGTQDTLEIYSTLHTDISDKTPKTLDALSPPDTQDILSAPPSLVSDKKTSSSSSCKASDRLSHMVVLKHSSPKPPRRMCRKVTPSPFPSLFSDSDTVPESCLDSNLCPEPDIAFNPQPTTPSPDPTTIPTNSVSDRINPRPEPNLSSNLPSNLDLTSAPDPDPDITPSPAEDPTSDLPQELTTESSYDKSIQGSKETQSQQVTPDEQSQASSTETVTAPKQSEPLDSVDMLPSHTDMPNIPEPELTSEMELIDEDEHERELQTKKLDLNQADENPQETTLSSPSSSLCVTPPVSCLTPPILSLSPPCFTPSLPNLSPPQCPTPPSHCLSSSVINTVSPATSFSSPPLSVSPTSSCLSSPPYLTPPMLSLSPPPLCPSPPSPCLSPPLLCLTPPVESEDFEPQVSSDMESLMLNTDSEEAIKEAFPQPGIPLLELEEKKEPDLISSSPRVAEPVSFPITIPSSTSHVLPHSQNESPEEFATPPAEEVSSSVPENKEAPTVPTDIPEQSISPQASGSVPAVEVLAESMYGDFEAAMDHLRYRLIATRNPEEIRGGGLLKYSNLLVRDYRPASETQIKTLERYMCSRFFIDFPDVQEQQRKILSYLKNHFIGEERSKYQYLMTLRRVVDDSTVCLMGHERRQTLNMITVLALKVLGEQNIIPNTDHVTCFYQPAPYLAEHSAPYLAEPSYCSYYIPQGGSTLLYQPYPLHLHSQTGLV